MKNEKLFYGLVQSYLKASNNYAFTTEQWKDDYKNSITSDEYKGSNNNQTLLISNLEEMFPFMFVDKVTPTLDKYGHAVWDINFNVQLVIGAVFLFVRISINKKYITARVMASKELLSTDFDLTDLIIKHNLLSKSPTNFNNKNQHTTNLLVKDTKQNFTNNSSLLTKIH